MLAPHWHDNSIISATHHVHHTHSIHMDISLSLSLSLSPDKGSDLESNAFSETALRQMLMNDMIIIDSSLLQVTTIIGQGIYSCNKLNYIDVQNYVKYLVLLRQS